MYTARKDLLYFWGVKFTWKQLVLWGSAVLCSANLTACLTWLTPTALTSQWVPVTKQAWVRKGIKWEEARLLWVHILMRLVFCLDTHSWRQVLSSSMLRQRWGMDGPQWAPGSLCDLGSKTVPSDCSHRWAHFCWLCGPYLFYHTDYSKGRGPFKGCLYPLSSPQTWALPEMYVDFFFSCEFVLSCWPATATTKSREFLASSASVWELQALLFCENMLGSQHCPCECASSCLPLGWLRYCLCSSSETRWSSSFDYLFLKIPWSLQFNLSRGTGGVQAHSDFIPLEPYMNYYMFKKRANIILQGNQKQIC